MAQTRESMRIAPSRHGGHWTIDDYDQLNFDTEDGWQRAIDIFEDRICGRFLNIVDAIQGKPFAGFAVMALDCLLIETLQQFYEGVAETPSRRSKEYFRLFLMRAPFSFDREKAEVFYDSIRCGILHQAEVKGSSLIRIGKETPLAEFVENGDGLVINRNLFHARLKEAFGEYLRQLRRHDPPDHGLRANFKRKMDAICRVSERVVGRLGILAYGSLLANPGEEIAEATVGRIENVPTPFAVEYARSSRGRAGAPTLVPVPGGLGAHVQAQILVLQPDIGEAQARDILYRRETNRVGDQRRRYDGQGEVQVRVLEGLAGVAVVLYSALPANIDEVLRTDLSAGEKASLLARLAAESVTEETYRTNRDGIRYLADAIEHGILTPLTEAYQQAILRLAGGAPALEEARQKIAQDQSIALE